MLLDTYDEVRLFTSGHPGREKNCENGHRGNMHLTSLPSVSVGESRATASSAFLVHDLCCVKCVELTYQ